jgi:hypothetical protein
VNKKDKIIFFCMIFVANAIFSQKLPSNRSGIFILPAPTHTISLTNYPAKPTPLSNKNKEVIAPDFYVRQLPFFCRQEIKFEKAVKIPFKFRVGSVEDCDRMEGKYKKN